LKLHEFCKNEEVPDNYLRQKGVLASAMKCPVCESEMIQKMSNGEHGFTNTAVILT